MKIVARQEEPVPVFADFFAFAAAPQLSNGLRFWAKPLQFDWTFVDQHFQQMGKPMPFHYRYARDMNSFISGLRANPEHQGMEAVVPFTGEPHNALHDAANQIDQLFAAKRGQFSETFS